MESRSAAVRGGDGGGLGKGSRVGVFVVVVILVVSNLRQWLQESTFMIKYQGAIHKDTHKKERLQKLAMSEEGLWAGSSYRVGQRAAFGNSPQLRKMLPEGDAG